MTTSRLRRKHRLASRMAALVASVLLVVACRANGPTATPVSPTTPAPTATESPSGSPLDPAVVYRTIEDQVVAIRGLEPKDRLVPTLLDEATLRSNLTAQFDKDNKPEDVATDERMLRVLGLLAPGVSLRDAYLDLVGDQVIGYYSPDDKALFIVSRTGDVGPIEQATFAHEFTHALQDQHFDLAHLGLDDASNGDRALARLALIEGDATITQAEWMLANLDTSEIAELIAAASDPEALAALARAPAILRETSLFPYQDGAAFVTAIRGDRGTTAIDAAFVAPPDSTEQVLHPAAYTAHEAPVAVAAPDPSGSFPAGWAVSREDTLGELVLRVWLREHGVRGVDAIAAAAGWGGDRVLLLEAAGGRYALGIDSRWDLEADAAEFSAAADQAVTDFPFAAVAAPTVRRVVVTIASDAEGLAALRGLYGVAS